MDLSGVGMSNGVAVRSTRRLGRRLSPVLLKYALRSRGWAAQPTGPLEEFRESRPLCPIFVHCRTGRMRESKYSSGKWSCRTLSPPSHRRSGGILLPSRSAFFFEGTRDYFQRTVTRRRRILQMAFHSGTSPVRCLDGAARTGLGVRWSGAGGVMSQSRMGPGTHAETSAGNRAGT